MDAPILAEDAATVKPLLLTLTEAANELRCGTRTVERIVARGALPVVRIGTAVRVRRADLERFVAGLEA